MIDLPLAVDLFGNAGPATIEQGQGSLDGLAHFAFGRNVDLCAGLEGGVDCGGEIGVRHQFIILLGIWLRTIAGSEVVSIRQALFPPQRGG
ncbi:hypothetical protein N8D56_00565 [Devosia sp. A8/3-2]|nr:hypothetical protein N8D56_00565 [Devosia sp. A8/3-2]